MGLAGPIPFYIGEAGLFTWGEAGLPHAPPPAGVKFGFGGGTDVMGEAGLPHGPPPAGVKFWRRGRDSFGRSESGLSSDVFLGECLPSSQRGGIVTRIGGRGDPGFQGACSAAGS